jgi:predicted N-acyltransferase
MLHDEQGLAAAAPAYIKTHSFGEFVFDFSWAQAYAQHDLAYYPKLVLGVPFTPATAPRLLLRPGVDAVATRQALVRAIEDFAQSRALSSVHGLFVTADEREAFGNAGWLPRFDVQFHWANRGYRDYDHFLEEFTARFRKKRKARTAPHPGSRLACETLLGPDLDRRTIDEVYDLHRDTFLRHGNEPYLTRDFFRSCRGHSARIS